MPFCEVTPVMNQHGRKKSQKTKNLAFTDRVFASTTMFLSWLLFSHKAIVI
jgi:hypothetical protein